MTPDTLPPGFVFADRYRIHTVIGAGSFGIVYSACDTETNDDVALKTLRFGALGDKELLQRFAREAQICGQLQHENTAKLRTFAEAPTTLRHPAMPYLIFDLVRGVALGRLIGHRGHLSMRETATVLAAVLDSLEEAHQIGIVHRDLKPDNVLAVPPAERFVEPTVDGDVCARLGIPPLDDPVWEDLTACSTQVVDFGLGKILEIDDRKVTPLTRAGMAAGTANYMSPEQLRAEPIDYRSDIYGAAMLLHRILLGRETYHGKTVAEVAMRQLEEPLPELPMPWKVAPIAEVFRKAGAKKIEERYQSAAEMGWALRCILDPTLAYDPAPEFHAPPPVRTQLPLTKRIRRFFGGS